MTTEEIMARMSAIMNSADGRDLTVAEVTEYESLEGDLQSAQRTQNLRDRHAAYNTTVIPAGVPSPRAGRPAENTSVDQGLRNYLLTGRISNAQSEGVPSEGGYLVAPGFRTKLVERLKAFGGIGSISERYTTGNGAPTEWPTVDDTANIGEIVQEGNTFSSGADVAFGSSQLGSYSYMAGGGSSTPIRVSRELLQDSEFDFEGWLARGLGTRIGRIQAVHWARGSGVTEPLGLITGLTPVQNVVNTGITYNSLVNAIHSVDPLYRANARWVFNDATMGEIEKITDSHGDPVFRGWGADLGQGFTETRLLGFPVTIDQAMPNLVVNSPTTVWGAFGDIRQGYVIRDVKSVELLVNPYSRMANRQVEFTAWARADGTQQDTNAYVTLSGKA